MVRLVLLQPPHHHGQANALADERDLHEHLRFAVGFVVEVAPVHAADVLQGDAHLRM